MSRGQSFVFVKKKLLQTTWRKKWPKKLAIVIKNSNYCTVFQGYHKFICQEVVRVANNM
jgi:hypothetical protein